MLPLNLSYITFGLLLFIPWSLIFYKGSHLRKEILTMSLISGFGSILTAYFWTIDWWKPATITGTRIGIEDFILGFAAGGIAAAIYEEVFRKRLYHRNERTHTEKLFFIILLTSAIFILTFFELKFTSFYAFFFSSIIYLSILIYLRKDLFISSFVNGILMVITVIPAYLALIFLFADFIQKTYPFKTLSGIKFIGVPIEEFIFWLFFGFGVALFYEYWQGLRLRSLPNKRR